MSASSYLDNLMRQGAAAHNARVVFVGTNVTVEEYDGGGYSAVKPLLLRFSPLYTSIIATGSLSHNFGTATWGAATDDGTWALCVGLQYLSDSTVQVCVGTSPEVGQVTTVINANATHPYYVTAPTSATGEIVWVAIIHNVLRQGGAWVMTNAYVEEKQ